MNRVPVILMLGAAIAGAVSVAAWANAGRSQVIKVSTFPWPEGPGPVVAALRPVPGIYVPLREIEGLIPRTLAANPPQSCRYGAKVQLTLRGGRVLTYGPCKPPASIERPASVRVGGSVRQGPLPGWLSSCRS